MTVNSVIAEHIYELVNFNKMEYVHFFTFDQMNIDSNKNIKFTFAVQNAELIAKKAIELLCMTPYMPQKIELPCDIITINN